MVFILHRRRTDLQELADLAKANPGKPSYGTPGVGTGNHLVGDMFKQRAGAPDIVHLPDRGMEPAISDLMGGQISLAIPSCRHHCWNSNRTGKLRGFLAVTSERCLSGAPRHSDCHRRPACRTVDMRAVSVCCARATPGGSSIGSRRRPASSCPTRCWRKPTARRPRAGHPFESGQFQRLIEEGADPYGSRSHAIMPKRDRDARPLTMRRGRARACRYSPSRRARTATCTSGMRLRR